MNARRSLAVRRAAFLGLAVAGAWSFASPAAGGSPPAAGAATMADTLHGRLRGATVDLPDGSRAAVVGSAGAPSSGSTPEPEPLLTREQLRVCLETVTEAEGWPAAWLVVQDAARDFDLVLRLELDDRGEVARPEFVFATVRREWEPGDVKRVVREATGRKPPRRGLGTLVVQGFTTRTETRLVHRVPAGAATGGLAALLPPGSLIRDTETMIAPGGERFTLALVLSDAEFELSDCADCAARARGHADTGEVALVMADPRRIVARLELTGELAPQGGRPRIPRYRCEPADAAPGAFASTLERLAAAPAAFQRHFADRERLPLIALEDLDGDGEAREVALPAGPADCDRIVELIVGVSTDPPGLILVGRRERAAE